VDCNAINPATVGRIAKVIAAARCPFVDGGIIGPPPKPGAKATRIYLSGPDAERVAVLAEYGLTMPVLPGPVGVASALKMSYAGITKGLTALGAAMMLAATRGGTADFLKRELAGSQPELLAWLTRQVPNMYSKAHRWVGEMEEIAATFAGAGLTPRILEGAADIYRFVGQTPLGAETPESRQRGQTLDDVIAILAASLLAGTNQEAPTL